jgi:hypothetical protein
MNYSSRGSSSSIHISQSVVEDEQYKIEVSIADFDNTFDQPNFQKLRSDYGWKYAAIYMVKTYFPHYTLQTSGMLVPN